ncbi:hypothetical protein SNE40_008153 [Patella caerulea]|uniref:Uncharacterized protein n=1 Tax=Patella caerulea TaxID=87958 RepID=A0AAN8Q3E2_PATCE
MAHLKSCMRLFAQTSRTCQSARRSLSSKAGQSVYRSTRPLLLGAITLGTGYGVYKYTNKDESPLETVMKVLPSSVSAAGPPESQPSVYSGGKDHALYLWINLKPTANSNEVAKSVAKIQKYVDQVTDPKLKDEEDEILAGVGFGPNFYAQVAGKTKKGYTYPHRKGALGDMPSSGGLHFYYVFMFFYLRYLIT